MHPSSDPNQPRPSRGARVDFGNLAEPEPDDDAMALLRPAMTADVGMTPRERTDLTRLARERGKVAKGQADLRAKELLADFEQQISSIYSFDDDAVWAEATRAAEEAVAAAKQSIDARCAELGIPKVFRPTLHMGWSGRGENAAAERRVELRRLAQARIAELTTAAKQRIDFAVLEATTALLAEGLTTVAARQRLDSLPDVATLMPTVDPRQLKALTIPGGWGTRRTLRPLSADELIGEGAS